MNANRLFLLFAPCLLAMGHAADLPNLSGLHVALDVGHSKAQGGAISAVGRPEFEYNLDMARTIAEVLRAAKAKVTVINEKGDFDGLAGRPRYADQIGAQVFLSIHHDSVNDKYLKNWEVDGKTQQYCDPRFSGYSVFCSKKNVSATRSRNWAKEVGAAMLNAGFTPATHHHEEIPGENRAWIDERTGVYEYPDLAVAKYGKLPSALLECGVILNRDEEQKVRTKDYQRKVGGAVASALASARGKGVFSPAPRLFRAK